MHTLFTRRILSRSPAGTSALGLLALAAALLLPSEARAQWTTSGATTSTTNTVGIGTSTPESSVHVSTTSTANGRGFINEQTSNDGVAAMFTFRKSRAGAAALNGDLIGHLTGAAFDGANFINSARLRFAVDGPVTVGSVPTSLQFFTGTNNSGVEQMRITSAGNVGIGTAEPGRKLEVMANDGYAARFYRNINNVGVGVNIMFAFNNSSNARTDYAGVHGLIGSNTAGAEAGNLLFTTATAGSVTEKMRITSTGNLGIGTTAPAAIVDGQRPEATDLLMRVWNTNASAGTTTFRLANSSNVGSRIQFTDQYSYVSTISAERNGGLRFRTGNASTEETLADRMSILPGGNVGIGTSAPTAKLHVAGNIVVDGNINAKYQDVAEWVPTTQKLGAGTVVVLDTGRGNHVLASHSAYDTRVAGVISAQPGLSLGEAGEGKVLVATTGRVKVKVDASKGAIQIGDLIVTSEVEGVAMRSEPVSVGGVAMHRPGTLIGKALEPLEKGTGEILVLLSLQ